MLLRSTMDSTVASISSKASTDRGHSMQSPLAILSMILPLSISLYAHKALVFIAISPCFFWGLILRFAILSSSSSSTKYTGNTRKAIHNSIKSCGGGRDRTFDLWGMNPTSYHCSTPLYRCLKELSKNPARAKNHNFFTIQIPGATGGACLKLTCASNTKIETIF